MSLEEKLAGIRQASAKRIPEDKRAVMARAIRELRDSGIVGRAVKAGDPLPAFALRNARGVEVRSSDLLARGALVLTVFRGHW